MSLSNFRQTPVMKVSHDSFSVHQGWEAVLDTILHHSSGTIAIELYSGVIVENILNQFQSLDGIALINTQHNMKKVEEIQKMIFPDVTNDKIFGYMTRLNLADYFPSTAIEQVDELVTQARKNGQRPVLVGPGALYLHPQAETRIYADMPRWETQLRQRKGLVDGLGTRNRDAGPKHLYKQAFFVDWRVLDRHKKKVLPTSHFYLETVNPKTPKLVDTHQLLQGLSHISENPFELMPFFDPGVWGGHWMTDTLGITGDAPNYAWCFNCVPEENSLLMGFGEAWIEIPSINLVFFQTENLLGAPVYARFGDEFPIRFDFLDTVGGQNLSFQVHPRTEYIREHFGMNYTQDESYYMLDAKPGALVYLGFKEEVSRKDFEHDLRKAAKGEKSFDDQRFVQTWPAKKHDHFLIPAGTVHCSGTGGMVLEISATPYIFTFKLWDWDRVDLDGKPRPINLEHGMKNIDFRRTTRWVEQNLVNPTKPLSHGPGWREERTGLHETEFIETRRYWFSEPIVLNTGGVEKGSVNVLNLVEGDEIVVESPERAFEPFVVHYAETFVIPAKIGPYTIRTNGNSIGKEVAVLRAFVRLEVDHE